MDQELKAQTTDWDPSPYSAEQNQIKPYPVQQNQPTPPYPVQQIPAQPPKPSNDVEAFLVATSTSDSSRQRHAAFTSQREPSPYRFLYPISSILGYLFCFMLGWVAVHFAKRSNLNWARGDKVAARSDAIKAVVFMVGSVVVGVILIAAIIVVVVVRIILL